MLKCMEIQPILNMLSYPHGETTTDEWMVYRLRGLFAKGS
jgi:hypothetical protein